MSNAPIWFECPLKPWVARFRIGMQTIFRPGSMNARDIAQLREVFAIVWGSTYRSIAAVALFRHSITLKQRHHCTSLMMWMSYEDRNISRSNSSMCPMKFWIALARIQIVWFSHRKCECSLLCSVTGARRAKSHSRFYGPKKTPRSEFWNSYSCGGYSMLQAGMAHCKSHDLNVPWSSR